MAARLQPARRIDRQRAVDGGFAIEHRVASFAGQKKAEIFRVDNLEGRECIMYFGKVDAPV